MYCIDSLCIIQHTQNARDQTACRTKFHFGHTMPERVLPVPEGVSIKRKTDLFVSARLLVFFYKLFFPLWFTCISACAFRCNVMHVLLSNKRKVLFWFNANWYEFTNKLKRFRRNDWVSLFETRGTNYLNIFCLIEL